MRIARRNTIRFAILGAVMVAMLMLGVAGCGNGAGAQETVVAGDVLQAFDGIVVLGMDFSSECRIAPAPGGGVAIRDPMGVSIINPQAGATIDFSRLTISGSVLNASDEPRHVGVAITFFDEYGNQVGSEIVQINNARPDVPYPFTSKLEMALDRPFSSSSTYVLYADAIAP